MEAPTFRKTGYPLQTKSWVKSSKPWVREVWDMSVRTLENCMMETYMDCPYYEQMQFIMDTRLQAMFTYVAGSDVRMAKKALKDFHYSMLPDGLIHGKYPSAYCQVISTFSLHYIYMMWEYYEQTKDLETVRRYLPDMDIILGYYDRKIGEDGLLGRIGFWEFVDWQEAWKETGGMPAALQKGRAAERGGGASRHGRGVPRAAKEDCGYRGRFMLGRGTGDVSGRPGIFTIQPARASLGGAKRSGRQGETTEGVKKCLAGKGRAAVFFFYGI